MYWIEDIDWKQIIKEAAHLNAGMSYDLAEPITNLQVAEFNKNLKIEIPEKPS